MLVARSERQPKIVPIILFTDLLVVRNQTFDNIYHPATCDQIGMSMDRINGRLVTPPRKVKVSGSL